MKTRLPLLSLALLALCPAARLPAAEIPVAHVPARTHANGDAVAPGTGRVMVSLRLGAPNHVLPDGTWMYSGYRVKLGDKSEGRPGFLLVRFAGGTVSRLSVADQATVIAMRAAKPSARPQVLVAADRR